MFINPFARRYTTIEARIQFNVVKNRFCVMAFKADKDDIAFDDVLKTGSNHIIAVGSFLFAAEF